MHRKLVSFLRKTVGKIGKPWYNEAEKDEMANLSKGEDAKPRA